MCSIPDIQWKRTFKRWSVENTSTSKLPWVKQLCRELSRHAYWQRTSDKQGSPTNVMWMQSTLYSPQTARSSSIAMSSHLLLVACTCSRSRLRVIRLLGDTTPKGILSPKPSPGDTGVLGGPREESRSTDSSCWKLHKPTFLIHRGQWIMDRGKEPGEGLN